MGGEYMTTDSWRERAQIRMAILKELYDYNFENGGKAKNISSETSDNEKRAALIYLADKNFVELIRFEHRTFPEARITAYGIDEVDSQM